MTCLLCEEPAAVIWRDTAYLCGRCALNVLWDLPADPWKFKEMAA